MEFCTRRIDEMTSREIEMYLQNGGDLVFVPFGPISGHGPNTSLGMHGHWAHAFSLIMAEKADGLVYPPVFSCFAGATISYRGTVPFTITQQVSILSTIAMALLKQGFKRVVLVAATTPEDLGGNVAVRQVFDETGKPVYLMMASKLLDAPEVKSLYDDYPGDFGESVIDFACMKILGRQRDIPYPKLALKVKQQHMDQPEDIAEDISKIRRLGTVGFRYIEENNHDYHGTVGIFHNGKSDIDLAVEVVHKSAEVAVKVLDNYSHYSDWLWQHPFKYIVPSESSED